MSNFSFNKMSKSITLTYKKSAIQWKSTCTNNLRALPGVLLLLQRSQGCEPAAAQKEEVSHHLGTEEEEEL